MTDGRNLVYFPSDRTEEEKSKFSESIKRPLKTSDAEDRKIIQRMIAKAFDISIKKSTGMRMMQGIYLLEEPISLYRCEVANMKSAFTKKKISVSKQNASYG